MTAPRGCYTPVMQEPSRSRKKSRITSLDIAHRAGVSQATVSRVLAGSPLVNAETRRRVEHAVKELNYKVDRHASSLRTQRAGTLALLLFEDPTSDDSHINPFFLSMLGSITRACARHGHDLLVSFQQLSDDWHADYEDSMKADGLILLGYGDYLAYEAKLAQLVAQGTHFVRWGHVWPDQPGVTIGCETTPAACWSAGIFARPGGSGWPSSAMRRSVSPSSTPATVVATRPCAKPGLACGRSCRWMPTAPSRPGTTPPARCWRGGCGSMPCSRLAT